MRWLQETRHYKPSTVSRRVSVLAGFNRTAVIDTVLETSPADYLRHPRVPPESPTLALTHLQFEAQLTAARTSPNGDASPCSVQPCLPRPLGGRHPSAAPPTDRPCTPCTPSP